MIKYLQLESYKSVNRSYSMAHSDLPVLFLSVPWLFGMGSYRISEVGVGRSILDDGKARFKVEALHDGNG